MPTAMQAAAIMNKLMSIGQGLGIFDDVLGHEPLSAPGMGEQVILCVFAGPMLPVGGQSGLASATMRWQINGRVYVNAMTKPENDMDPRIVESTSLYLEALCAQFTLGGLVRCVDVFGMSGEPLKAESGYITQDKAVYRAMELEIPLIINDVFTLAP